MQLLTVYQYTVYKPIKTVKEIRNDDVKYSDCGWAEYTVYSQYSRPTNKRDFWSGIELLSPWSYQILLKKTLL